MISSRGMTALAMTMAIAIGACGSEEDGKGVDELRKDSAGARTSERGHWDGTGSTVTGRITLAGDPPELEPFEITANADVCGTAVKSNLLTLGEGNGIEGAVVWLEIQGDGPPREPLTVDQIGCQYAPHVVAAPVGTVIRFTNSDPAPHNVRIEEVATGTIHLNVAQPNRGDVDEWTIPSAGTYFVGCDYHPWMNAYVVGTPGPYVAVTKADGTFDIANVPPGEYGARVWHNSLKMREKKDQGGRMIGYRFDEPVVTTARVMVTKDSVARLDVALELDAETKEGSQ